MGLESKIGEVHSISSSPLYWVENFLSKILKSRFSPSGGTGGSPYYPKNRLFSPCSLLFFPKNVNFVIFMQCLAILPKIPPPTLVEIKWETLKRGNQKKKECLGELKIILATDICLGWLTMFFVK